MIFYNSQTHEMLDTTETIQDFKNIHTSLLQHMLKLRSHDVEIKSETIIKYKQIINSFNKLIYEISEEIDNYNNNIIIPKNDWGKRV